MTARRVIVAAAVWSVVTVALLLSDSQPAVLALGGIVVVMVTATFGALDLARSAAPTVHRGDSIDDLIGGRRRRSDDAAALALRNSLLRARRFRSVHLRDELVELIEDRLAMAGRGDRAPGTGAEVVLTPTLRRLVDDTSRSVRSVRELRRAITDIEAL